MDKNIIIYFFVVLFFIRNIFKDIKLLLFFILSGIIVYVYITYHSNSYTNSNYNSNIEDADNVIYKYGTIPENKTNLDNNEINKLKYIKDAIDSMDIENRSKIEIET